MPMARAMTAICALLLTAPSLASGKVSTHLPDADVVWDSQFVRGAESTLQVSLWGATSLLERVPAKGTVRVVLAEALRKGSKKTPKTWTLWDGATAADGSASPRFDIPPRVTAGSYRLLVRTRSAHGDSALSRTITVADTTVVQVRTDRPMYKPGQTIHWRATVVNASNGKPMARQAATVTIRDPRRTQIWRDRVKADASGMLSGSLPLAEDLVTGKYTVQVRSGAGSAEVKVSVRPFELPPFFASASFGKAVYAAGASVTGEVSARYPYGEPVRGRVRVSVRDSSQGVLWSTRGRTNSSGAFPITFKLPSVGSGRVTVTAQITDGAGRSVHAESTARWGARPMRIVVIPESGRLIPGVEQAVSVATLDDLGRPVPAKLELDAPLAGLKAKTVSSEGVARVMLQVPKTIDQEVTRDTSRLAWMRVAAGSLSPKGLELLDKRVNRVAHRLMHCARWNNPVAGTSAPNALDVTVEYEGTKLKRLQASVLPFQDRKDFRVPLGANGVRCLTPHVSDLARDRKALGAPGKGRIALRFNVRRWTRTAKEARRVYHVELGVDAVAPDGRRASTRRHLRVNTRAQAASLRVASPIVDAGEPIRAFAEWPKGGGPVLATLVQGDSAVTATFATRRSDGRLEAVLKAPRGVFGLASVRFSQWSWPKQRYGTHTRVETRAANVYLKPELLDVQLAMPARVTPGKPVALEVSVRDRRGNPVRGAGLAASVVDERVLALGKPQVSLVDALTGPDLERAKHAGLAFREHALKPELTPLDRLISRVILDSLRIRVSDPNVFLPAAERWRVESKRLHQAYSDAITALSRTPGAVVVRAGKVHTPRTELAETIAPMKPWSKKPERLRDPWGRSTTWSYLRQVMPSTDGRAIGVHVTNVRIDALTSSLHKRRGAARATFRRKKPGALASFLGKRRAHLLTDAWGSPFVVRANTRLVGMDLVSPGPDGVLGTKDDISRADVLEETSRGYGGLGMKGMGYGGGGGRSAKIMVGKASLRGGRRVAAVRKRFDETVLWSVGERTDNAGKTTYRFDMAESITGWQVEVEAVSGFGGFGRAVARTETFLPRSVSLQLPDGLTVGDRYGASVIVANHGASAETLRVVANARGALVIDGDGGEAVTLKPGETAAVPVRIKALLAGRGTVKVTLDSPAGATVDALEKTIVVQAQGALERRLLAARVEEGAGRIDFDVPEDAVPGSVEGRVRVFRGASDLVLDGLEDMIREPYGCFEQTSSATYPNLLVMRLLKGVPGSGTARARARKLVGKGYQRLLGYEVQGGGFSWFGERPANRVLTAYGLMEFTDMAAVYPVDPAMIRRTRRWLARTQTANGSFVGDHRFGSAQAATTAYITWALAQSGGAKKAVAKGLGWLRRNASKLSKDAYVLALWANAEAAAKGGDPKRVTRLLAAHAKPAAEGGLRFGGGSRTLFYGYRKTAQVETTALVAMLGSRGRFAGEGDPLRWLWSARDQRYGWGSTQATVLALRAAAENESRNKAPRKGDVTLAMNERRQGKADLAAAALPTFTVRPGVGKGALAFTAPRGGGGALQAEMRLWWRGKEPARAQSSGLAVHLTAGETTTRVGEQVQLKVAIMNTGTEEVAMPTVVIPVPPGFRADHASLKQLKRRGVSRFEDRGDRIHLYMKLLGAKKAIVLPYRLEATSECDVMQRGAEAYAYYEPTTRGRSGSLRLTASKR